MFHRNHIYSLRHSCIIGIYHLRYLYVYCCLNPHYRLVFIDEKFRLNLKRKRLRGNWVFWIRKMWLRFFFFFVISMLEFGQRISAVCFDTRRPIVHIIKIIIFKQHNSSQVQTVSYTNKTKRFKKKKK